MNISFTHLRALLSPATAESLRPHPLTQPVRDWGILLVGVVVCLFAAVAGALVIHQRVAEGTFVSVERDGQARLEVFHAEALDALLLRMDERGQDHTEALVGLSSPIDPSK